MEHVHCTLCGADDAEPVLVGRDRLLDRHDEFHLVRCRACGLHYIDPRPTVDELPYHYSGDYAPHRTDGGNKQRSGLRLRMHERRERNERRVLQRFYGWPGDGAPGRLALLPLYLRFRSHWKSHWKRIRCRGEGRILDVGCGAGARLHFFHENGWQATGIDIGEDAARHARETLGLNVITGDLLEHRFDDASFDVVTMWEVLEHLTRPIDTLREIHRILRPGGELVLSTPNADSAPARWFRERWFSMDLPRHLCLFSPATARRALEDAGFEAIEVSFDRSGLGVSRSLDYVEREAGSKRAKRLNRRWIIKLIGRWLALTHQSDGIRVSARKGEL